MANRVLTPEEQRRLERQERTRRNKRGRKNPAIVPDRLSRTSAFAAKRQGLNTDSNFTRVYEVPGYSVVEVRGRELGSQHRDAIYALFRLPRHKVTIPNPDWRPKSLIQQHRTFYQTSTTWRDLIKVMGRTEHVNNMLSLLDVFREIQQVSLLIYEGRSLQEVEKIRATRSRRQLPDVYGSSEPMITSVNWTGAQLDSEVVVTYGTSVLTMIEKAQLVSLNADVQFRLKSDHAKVFWPFIDSQPNHTYIDEERLAQLAGRDLWGEGSTSAHRAQFRKECREAFKDMVAAEGLSSYEEIVTGSGRSKGRRYTYKHAAPRQFELDILTKVSPTDQTD